MTAEWSSLRRRETTISNPPIIINDNDTVANMFELEPVTAMIESLEVVTAASVVVFDELAVLPVTAELVVPAEMSGASKFVKVRGAA